MHAKATHFLGYIIQDKLIVQYSVIAIYNYRSQHAGVTCSFFPAATNLWNELPYHTAHVTTINSFCNLLTH